LIRIHKDVERNFAHINHKGKKTPLFEFGIMPPVEMTDVDMKDATTPPAETTEVEPAKKDVDSITVEGIKHFSPVSNDYHLPLRCKVKLVEIIIAIYILLHENIIEYRLC
jgi:hypothetical protein